MEVGGGAGGFEGCLQIRVMLYEHEYEEVAVGMRKKGRTFALGKFPIPLYTRLSSRCTSVSIILSSNRRSSVRRVSMSAIAGLYCCVSSCLCAYVSTHTGCAEGSVGTHKAASLVSRLCLRNIRFSCFAHSMFVLSTSICVAWLSGICAKKSSSVRTGARVGQ